MKKLRNISAKNNKQLAIGNWQLANILWTQFATDKLQLAISNWQILPIAAKRLPIAHCQMIRSYRLLPIAYCLLLILSSCGKNEQNSKSDNSQIATNDKTQKVEVVQPQSRSFTAEVLITGTTSPNQMVTLYAMESGMLTQMRKDIGDKVKQGETLAILQNPELQQQQLRWQAETNAKKSYFNRLKAIYEKTPALTNIQMIENAEADYLSSQANLTGINKRIGFLNVRAPFSGTITKRLADKGAMIQSGMSQSKPQALFEIQEINPIRLSFPVPESDAGGIQKGMEVEITLPELSGTSFMAKVSRTSNALDPMSKTMQVEIDIPNPDGKILSGMYAKALLQINSRKNILSLPLISKVSYKNEDYILAVQDGIVRKLPVKIGLSNQDYFEVLNDDITATTQVILKGKSLVKEGEKVDGVLKQ